MFTASPHRHLIGFDGKVRIDELSTSPPKSAPSKEEAKIRLEALKVRLAELQDILWAFDSRALLVIFQAMDAAGKDSTIRAVLSGVNPIGCEVHSFKAPNAAEVDQDFLWRSAKVLPSRGKIGVFNRSYYEEVLVVRVHPEYLERQRIPELPKLKRLWEERYESIRDHELHLARNGTVVVKLWLNVSKKTQKKRFLKRLDEPEKNWKFSSADVAERAHFDAYMAAYEEALAETSRPHAPWYAIPADDKAYMQLTVAEILVETLERMGLKYPEVKSEERARFDEIRALLQAEDD
jgi:PPK2 family polyphosphate:nucleotide phosphotransferase